MSKQDQTTPAASPLPRRRRKIRRIVAICLLAVLIALIIGLPLAYAYNNVSLTSNRTFARRLDKAIADSLAWTQSHRQDILAKPNVALIRMLQDINTMAPNPLCSGIVDSFMAKRVRPNCWKRLLDPDWPVIETALNETIDQVYLDTKWILCAIAPECAKVTPEQIGLFEPDRWQAGRLTHQLWALIHFRRTQGSDDKLDSLVEHLCDRITESQRFDMAVVDLYIQKVAFVLMAGHPQKVRRRWVERVIANQRSDGGWNDRWFLMTSIEGQPFSLSPPPSNQHATVQALWLLYQVKYRCPEQFGLQNQ